MFTYLCFSIPFSIIFSSVRSYKRHKTIKQRLIRIYGRGAEKYDLSFKRYMREILCLNLALNFIWSWFMTSILVFLGNIMSKEISLITAILCAILVSNRIMKK